MNLKSDQNNDDKTDATEYWQRRYTKKVTAWQKNDVHEGLMKYVHFLEDHKPCTIFVPLCGKTVDIQWLYSRGHNILAADFIEETVLEQFRLLNITYNVDKVSDDLTIYESDDKRVKILKCDFLTLDCSTYLNSVEGVWDRASLVALNDNDQQVYVTQIRKILKPNFSYLLESLSYDETKMEGPPFSVPQRKIEKYYGDFCEIRPLEDMSYKVKFIKVPLTVHYYHLVNK